MGLGYLFNAQALLVFGILVALAEAIAAGRNRLDVPDPEGMKQRLDALSMSNFLKVIDMALEGSGCTRADIDSLNILHMKRSAHDYVLRELGLRQDQTYYLSQFGHIGQQDQMVSIEKGLETGRLKDGDLMVMVAAAGVASSASRLSIAMTSYPRSRSASGTRWSPTSAAAGTTSR